MKKQTRHKMETKKISEPGLAWFLKHRKLTEQALDDRDERQYKLWLEAQAKRMAENR